MALLHVSPEKRKAVKEGSAKYLKIIDFCSLGLANFLTQESQIILRMGLSVYDCIVT